MKPIDLSIPTGAIFSDDRTRRYALWRVWNPARKPMMMIGLNPSKADEFRNDPTITRGMARSVIEGYGAFLMGNLYSLVSTDPAALKLEPDTIRYTFTDKYLLEMICLAGIVVCGWGSFPVITTARADRVLRMIPEPYCLGINKDGQPKHPLYIGYNVPMIKYSPLR